MGCVLDDAQSGNGLNGSIPYDYRTPQGGLEMDKEAQKKIDKILTKLAHKTLHGAESYDWKAEAVDQVLATFAFLGYRRVICPECGQVRGDDERVKAGMRCRFCAYGEEEVL